MDQLIRDIPYVGPSTYNPLEQAGVRTIGDILSYSGGPIPGMRTSIEKVREKARQQMAKLSSVPEQPVEERSEKKTPTMISSHSWRDVTIHYRDQRTHRFFRGVIRHLVVKSNVVGLLVEYPSSKNPRNYVLQSPMLLFHLQQEWLRDGYVTDDSDDEHEYPGGNDPPCMYMPPLLPDRNELDEKFPPGTPDRRSIDFYLREINSLYAYHASID